MTVPRLTPAHYRTLLRVFRAYGCEYRGKEGSHHVLRFPGAKRAVVIPEYSEIDVDIIKNNMRTVGMTREQYFDLLERC